MSLLPSWPCVDSRAHLSEEFSHPSQGPMPQIWPLFLATQEMQMGGGVCVAQFLSCLHSPSPPGFQAGWFRL